MHEKMGRAHEIARILDSARVRAMDPHERHALAVTLGEKKTLTGVRGERPYPRSESLKAD